jgi:APA family basic amino acid/polyamine antiporter
MFFEQLFAKKSLETLLEEAKGENRLRRILGPVGLTSLGVGAIIGAGIFVMTGRAAAQDAGPAIMLSYVVAGIGCLFAALCYAEFASMAPVAGSAYTYAYATLGELLAWIIGWDLILEYAMACACVASSWSKYLNEFLLVTVGTKVPEYLCNDPFSTHGAFLNLPALLITLAVTVILVIGIKESATANAVLVAVKLGVVLFVIGVGVAYINTTNWTKVPATERIMPEQELIPEEAKAVVKDREKDADDARVKEITRMALASYMINARGETLAKAKGEGELKEAEAQLLFDRAKERYAKDLPAKPADQELAKEVIARSAKKAPGKVTEKWGLLGLVGLNQWLVPIDNSVRGPFAPYGLAGIVFGASIVFFAYIGFDSISTHSEEAMRPQRDVPFAILASLVLCTFLYIGVSAVITGMVPYPDIDPKAAVAAAFRQRGEMDNNAMLKGAAGLIATGALAGMTSVLLITFLSQARIFLAMARDHLLPPAIFGAIHEKFRTPHISTMLTGGIIALVAALTPITKLEEMVNIGTLMAFVIVCGAVLILRRQSPDAYRPFRCPLISLVAPLGILVNLVMMLFLPVDTWLRLVVWLAIGLVIYFSYGMWRSTVGQQLRGLVPAHLPNVNGQSAPAVGPSEAIKRAGTDVQPNV